MFSFSVVTHILEVFELIVNWWVLYCPESGKICAFSNKLWQCVPHPCLSAKKSGFPILHRHHYCCFKLVLFVVAFALLETQALKNHEVGLQITWFSFFFFNEYIWWFWALCLFYFNLLKYILGHTFSFSV